MLEPAGVAAVHEAALRVLGRTGVTVRDDAAVAILRSHGARAAGQRVYMDESMVEKALAAASPSFALVGRRPERDVRFGEGRAVYGSASGSANILKGDRLHPGTIADLDDAIRLGHESPAIGFLGDSLAVLDLPERQRTRRGAFSRVTLSDKACEWVAATDDDLDVAIGVNEILFGAEWHHEPRALVILNTNSPLQLSGEMARTLVRWARLRQPVCVTSCVMGGTTGPASLPGVLVVQHAEVLAALVLAQHTSEGCPFIYGGLSAMASMRDGAIHFGTREFAWLAQATVRLAQACSLPVRAGAAVTDAHRLDAQAAMESVLGLSAAAQAGADFLFQAAGVLGSFKTLSLEKFVVDHAAIVALTALEEPAAAGDDALAVDAIDAAGPGGHYLAQPHTRRHARELDQPTFFGRETYGKWRAFGEPDVGAAAAREVARLLAEHEAPSDLDQLVRRQLRRFCHVAP